MQENKVTDIAPEDLDRLGLLIEQGQFELLLPKVWENADVRREVPSDVRLVYLMNDAVESFLVFQNARMCGTYQEKFDGELSAALATEEDGYVLAVHQGMNAFTLFFTGMVLEAHLFDYGHTGHFWVKGYEYLRQLEYRLAILHDKLEYLGEEFCGKEERQLASLAEFPPLNYCCYPAVPKKYRTVTEPDWNPSEAALQVMCELAKEVGDVSLLRALERYRRKPGRYRAKQLGRLMHRMRHAAVVDLLAEQLTEAAGIYKKRSFPDKELEEMQRLYRLAEARAKELRVRGLRCEIVEEEPFVYARDSIAYKVYVIVWQRRGWNRVVRVEEIKN